MSEPDTYLIGNDLAMRYGRKRVFQGLMVQARPGAPLAVLGRNGSGKSTLLKILAGVLTPTSGDIELTVDGVAVSASNVPFHVGFVAPYLRLYEPFSARENLEFLVQARRLQGGKARMERLLERVGLADRADGRVSAYSTGMKQRLRIAAALLHDPPVLLLDEPSVSLDEHGKELVEQIARDERRIVVLATNDRAEASFCTSTVLLA